jgi:exonuclease VII large subunit
MVAPDRAHIAAAMAGMLAGALNAGRNAVVRDRALVEGAFARCERAMPDIGRLKQRLEDCERRSTRAVTSSQQQRRADLEVCERQLHALDPQRTLNRGYAVVHKDGRVVSSIAQVTTGDGLVVKVADGGFPARVDAPGTKRRRARPAVSTSNGKKPPAAEQAVQKALLF